MAYRKFILIGIVLAIITGFVFGGILPEYAEKVSLLGEILLNLLMMIVVPLIIFSIINGITSLGNLRSVGRMGKRTIAYYLATTMLSVITGLILVNLIRPGEGISSGENHPEASYIIDAAAPQTVHLVSDRLGKERYGSKYRLVLADQGLQGRIVSSSSMRISVKQWEETDRERRAYLSRPDRSRVPVSIIDGSVTVTESRLKRQGTGISIGLPAPEGIMDRQERGLSGILEEILVGDKKTGREGLIPRNIFYAMVNMDFLALIFFAILFGIALSSLGDKGAAVNEIIAVINDAIHTIVEWIMLFVPFGIFGIISARIGAAGGFSGFLPELLGLGKYFATVVMGLSIHAFLVLPLILVLFGRRNPFRFMSGVVPALLNAFSTASSSATLPLTMEGVEAENGVSRRVSSFVLPIGATMNMDGTALYEAVAAMFIAQVYGVDLGGAAQVIIFLTATLAAIGAAGIPEAGLVTMVIVLNAVGLPLEGIGLLLTIDWLLDRFRTTVNVWGDAVGAGVIEALESK
ncbi:MAG: dicarboxylate/amino acid:cation symporter [Spirochaetes bacterium]|nr:dicarboxylate/amino acid:cation symporter [Spirochaetota bacterium]